MFLGEFLIQKKLMTKRELEIALDEQKSTNDFLGLVLVRRNYLKEEDLLKALSELYRIPFVSLKNEYIDWDLAMRFSASLVIERQCLPFREGDFTVTAAIVNPLDAGSISQIEDHVKGKKVNLVLVTSADMQEALKNYQKRITAKINKLLEG